MPMYTAPTCITEVYHNGKYANGLHSTSLLLLRMLVCTTCINDKVTPTNDISTTATIMKAVSLYITIYIAGFYKGT